MADDDDQIFVDIVPRVNDSVADEETRKLRDKFKDTGEKINESLSHVGDKFGDKIKGSAKSIGSALDDLKGRAKGFGDSFAESAAKGDRPLSRIGDTIGGLSKSLDDLGKVAGVDLGKITSPANDVANSLKHANDIFKDFSTNVLKDVPILGEAFKNLGPAIEAALGPLSVALASVQALEKFGETDLGKKLALGTPAPGESLTDPKSWFSKDSQEHDWHIGPVPIHDPYGWEKPFLTPPKSPQQKDFYHQNYPTTSGPGAGGNYLPQALPPGVGGVPGMGAPSIAPPDTGGAHTSGATIGGGVHARLVDYTRPSTPSVSSAEDLPGAGGSVANLYRFSESLVGTPYSTPLRNDCSGMISELANVAVGLPPETGGRFATPNEGARLAQLGFQPGLGGKDDFNIGWNPAPGQSGHTAGTLPGGTNVEQGGNHPGFLMGKGAAGATDPFFSQHAHLSMAGFGGGGGGGMGLSFGSGGVPAAGGPGGMGGGAGLGAGPGGAGAPGMPALGQSMLPPPGSGGGINPQGATPGVGQPPQQQQLGTGKGFGISGGLIGGAEQAGVMAAGIGGFGGGAIAAQIAEQEINLAIQKGGQAAATLAAAPFETLGLAGGQMGAESVNVMGGWGGKFVSGLMGASSQLPNVSGAAQKPKDPQGGDQQQGPGKDGQQKQSGPKPPTGHEDDPIHVKSSGGGGGQNQQQGAQTSGMSTISPALSVMTA